MINKQYALTFALLIVLCISSYSQNDVVLHTPTGNLYGTLLEPNDQATSIVLMISGSGPTDRDGNNPMMKNNSLKFLAEGFQRLGIASMRYDKRGIAASKDTTIQEANMLFENFIEDARAWKNYLRKLGKYNKIYILGHSEGALIGAIISQDEDVDGLISLAGAGYPANQILRTQLQNQPQFIQDMSSNILSKLEKGELVDDVPMMMSTLFRPSIQKYLLSWFRYDPAEELGKVKKPVLIVQGTKDAQVSVDNAERLHTACPNAQYQLIENMNHVLKTFDGTDLMKNFETYNIPILPVAKGLPELISDFINKSK